MGVHTPEFGFESDIDNVVAQTRNLGIEYPVAVDSGYRVWGAFANSFWPAVYIADAAGRIRHHHFGEGEYPQTEMVIQRLLLDAGTRDLDLDLVAVEPRGLEVAADWQSLRSPETYVGYLQSSGFASEGTAPLDLPHEYSAAPRLPLNSWDLSGNWTVARHAAGSNAPPAPGSPSSSPHATSTSSWARGRRAPRSRSGSPSTAGPVDDAHGSDVASDGRGIVRDQNTYQLIRQSGPISSRRFEIEFLEAGAEVYCFTFG